MRRAVVALGATALVLAASVASASPVLSGPHYYPATGSHLFPVAVADFNRDGVQDIVVGSEDNATVSVLYGKKGGGFQPNEDYPGGSYPFWISTADFNHDHRPDIAVASYDIPGTVTVLLSKHVGFRSPDTYMTDDDSWAMAVADLNRDGNPDLAVANYTGNDVTILLGRRNGTFKHGHTLKGSGGPDAIVASDLNHDHKIDLAVLNYSAKPGSVQVFLGKGNGTFKHPRKFKAGATQPPGMVAGNFTGDGNLDLAVPECSGSGGNKVYLLAGTSKGTFKKPHGYRNFNGSCSYVSAAADLNHDGRQDIETAIDTTSGSHSGDISVLFGKKGGKLSKPKFFKATGSGDANYSIVAARLNGDGKPDLVVPDYDAPRVAVVYGKG